MEKFENRKYTV